MKKLVDVSIVIPCLNEEKTLPIVIKKSLESFKRLRLNGEVLVVDNCSTDSSSRVAKESGARVLSCTKRGYGNALMLGFSKAKGEILIMGDADDTYDFSKIDGFIKNLNKGYDLVVGSRLKGNIEKGAMPFLHRYLGTPVLTFILNIFFGTSISDCNSGMRGFTKKVFKRMDLRSEGMEFASEMIVKAGILKLRIKEIKINFSCDKRECPPHLRTWQDGWRHLKYILVYAPNIMFIWPSLIFFTLGSSVMLLQIGGPFSFKDIYMDIHSMIFGLTLSIIGITVFEMGMIIKLFSSLNNYYKNDKLVTLIDKISLDKSLIIGSLILIFGIAIDSIIFIKWANNGFHNIQLSRLAIIGLYLIFTGVSFISFTFLRLTMKR